MQCLERIANCRDFENKRGCISLQSQHSLRLLSGSSTNSAQNGVADLWGKWKLFSNAVLKVAVGC